MAADEVGGHRYFNYSRLEQLVRRLPGLVVKSQSFVLRLFFFLEG
jgi:hypothetical protein